MKNFDKCFSNMAASGLYQDITIPVKTQPIGIEKSFSAHCIHFTCYSNSAKNCTSGIQRTGNLGRKCLVTSNRGDISVSPLLPPLPPPPPPPPTPPPTHPPTPPTPPPHPPHPRVTTIVTLPIMRSVSARASHQTCLLINLALWLQIYINSI